jgi:hypothetical protein
LRKIACSPMSLTAIALHKAVETTRCAAGLVALPNANGIRKKHFFSKSYVFKYSQLSNLCGEASRHTDVLKIKLRKFLVAGGSGDGMRWGRDFP